MVRNFWGTCFRNLLAGKKTPLLLILVSFCSFTGGVVMANGVKLPLVLSEKLLDDKEWAVSTGLVSAEVAWSQSPSQAEFLKRLITVYKPAQQGVIVPKGAENHWAAPYYATAKSEGLIDCSCQIKPDESITYQEASKFIMRAINKKAGKELVKLEEVQAWVKHAGDVTTPVTNLEAVTFLRKMDGVFEANHLKKEVGEKGNEKTRQ